MTRRGARILFAAVLSLTLSASLVQAQGSAQANASQGPGLTRSLGPNLFIAALAGGAIAVSRLIVTTPAACSWCVAPDFDRSARSALAWSGGHAGADVLSAETIAGPMVLATASEIWNQNLTSADRIEDALILGEAVGLSVSVNDLVKRSVARLRPDGSDDVSFYSGHTSVAFAFATSLYRVHRLRGDKHAKWWLVGGMVAAAETGYLRIAADKHYLSDVLTGAAAGSLIGVLVPEIHKRHFPNFRTAITRDARAVFLDINP